MKPLLAILLFPGASLSYSQCTEAPDLVIINANIITMDPGNPTASAIAIRNGNIMVIGNEEDMKSLLPENCPVKWLDAEGLTMLPGFNDSHCHWLSWPEHICDAPGHNETTYPELAETMNMISMHGWTSISELNFGRPALIPEHLQNAMALEANGDLNVRLNGYWGTFDNIDLLDELDNYGYEAGHTFSDRIRAPGVKMYVDDPFGTADIMDQATCSSLVAAAHAAGYQVAAHCVNQTAVEKILNAYENALGTSGNENIRHRIEHAVKVSDQQLNRIDNKGILLSFQLMGPPDWPEQTTFQTYLSNSNTSYLLRWKDFIDRGVPVTGSTDAPFNNSVCHYSPFRAIYQAITRNGYIDRVHAGWELDQRISIEAGIKLLTVDGAWATGEENVKGNLVAGKYADLTIVSQDPLSVQNPGDLLSISSLLTMVGGEVEYCDDAFTGLCDPLTAFRIDTQLILVSHFIQDQPAGNAFDQDAETAWVSGDFPPQLIEIDLGKNTLLDRIELDVEQFPSGFTRHQLTGSEDGEDPVLLHEFANQTEAGQTLVYSFQPSQKNLRRVRITTIESPSWVAWKEIRLIPEGTGIGEPVKSRYNLSIFPNPTRDHIHVSLNIRENPAYLKASVLDINGSLISEEEISNLRMDNPNIELELSQKLSPGIYVLRLSSSTLTYSMRFIIQ